VVIARDLDTRFLAADSTNNHIEHIDLKDRGLGRLTCGAGLFPFRYSFELSRTRGSKLFPVPRM